MSIRIAFKRQNIHWIHRFSLDLVGFLGLARISVISLVSLDWLGDLDPQAQAAAEVLQVFRSRNCTAYVWFRLPAKVLKILFSLVLARCLLGACLLHARCLLSACIVQCRLSYFCLLMHVRCLLGVVEPTGSYRDAFLCIAAISW